MSIINTTSQVDTQLAGLRASEQHTDKQRLIALRRASMLLRREARGTGSAIQRETIKGLASEIDGWAKQIERRIG